MLPWSLTPHLVTAQEVVLPYLQSGDIPWLRALLDAYRRFVGRRRRALDEHLQAPLTVPCSRGRLKQARYVLDGLWDTETAGAMKPSVVRAALFTEAAGGARRDIVLGRVARRLRVDAASLERALFADLSGERRLCPEPEGLNPGELALRINLAMAQGMLGRARQVWIALDGHARTVVSQARWVGLMCTVRPAGDGLGVTVEVSGPLSLFHRTRVYGRALAGLVGQLAWCERFRLTALCELAEGPRRFVLQTGDPVFPAAPPQRFDSRLEAQFFADFQRAAPDWDLIREPEPVPAGGTLIFPDFAIRHRRHAWRRWLLEIVGFWTPDYLRDKVRQLRLARLSHLILCLDADRSCGDGELPRGVAVVRYKRRIDPLAVLRIIDDPACGLRG